MIKTTFKLLVSMFLFFACSYSNIYINREKDNNDGKIFLNRFYNNIAGKNFNDIDMMVNDSLKQLAGRNGISKMAIYINRKVGDYKGYTIVDYYIRAIEGSTNETSYNYKLKVSYQKGTVDELIGLRKQNGSAITMNSYHANSDLLIH